MQSSCHDGWLPFQGHVLSFQSVIHSLVGFTGEDYPHLYIQYPPSFCVKSQKGYPSCRLIVYDDVSLMIRRKASWRGAALPCPWRHPVKVVLCQYEREAFSSHG